MYNSVLIFCLFVPHPLSLVDLIAEIGHYLQSCEIINIPHGNGFCLFVFFFLHVWISNHLILFETVCINKGDTQYQMTHKTDML